MASLRKRGKVWSYTITDADGRRRETRGRKDKRVTEQMAAKAEMEVDKVKAGLTDPKSEARRRYASRPLAEHLDEWQSRLIAAGGTAKHADLSLDRARRLASLVMGATMAEIDPPRTATKADRERVASKVTSSLASARLSDLTADAVQGALATLKNAGRSLGTCNHHRRAIKGFSRWAWMEGRTLDDSLAGVRGYNEKTDRRHDRRTLNVDDLRKLIDAAHQGATYRGLTGPERALCYRLAVNSGLRFSEIASITPRSFTLDSPNPEVTVTAAYTKNGDPAKLPLPTDLAADLREYLAGKPANLPAFALSDRGADLVKFDLAAAGIPYRDQDGLVFDFHSLRCQCATLADAAGSSPRVVQRLMRHSTLELTGRSTRPTNEELVRATSAFPDLRPYSISTEPQIAGDDLAAFLPCAGDAGGRMKTGADAITITAKPTLETPKPLPVMEFGDLWHPLTQPA